MAGQIMARVAFASSVSSHQMDSKPIQHYSTLFNIKLNHRHQMPTAKPLKTLGTFRPLHLHGGSRCYSCPSPWDPSEDPGQLSPPPEFGDVQNWFVDTLWQTYKKLLQNGHRNSGFTHSTW
jgi:hypothetical protein